MAFALQQSNGGNHGGDDEYAGNGVGQHLLHQSLGRDGELVVCAMSARACSSAAVGDSS